MLNPISEHQHDFDHIDYLNLSENGPTKRRKNSGKSVMTTGLSCVGVCWSVLSFISLLLSLISFFMPYWIEGSIETSVFINGLSDSTDNKQVHNVQVSSPVSNYTHTYFGLWRRCNYHVLTNDGYIDISYMCGRYTTFYDIPTIWWKIASVLTALGCVLTMFISFFGILACCISNVMSNSVAKTVGILQFIAGLLLTLGCVLFPFGWENNLELQQACGPEISVYKLGDCTICWAYWVAVAGGGLTLFCSLLGCYSAKQSTRLRYDRVGL